MKPVSGTTHTTCPYCGVGCGVLATPAKDGLSAEIEGDPKHPANFGRLCSKGSSLGETLTLDERLLYPEVDGERASWDDALSLVATRFKEAIEKYGPDSVAIYGSGQLLTEDYYVANKLMKGFIGSGNMDTNSRLCMASSVVGHKRAFGSDTVPGCYEDIEESDLIILIGSNFAWCHPVLHQRLLAAKEKRGARLVVIDPRKTASSASADLHLQINPGADVALFNALLVHLVGSPAFNAAYINRYTDGFDAAIEAAKSIPLARTSEVTGISMDDLQTFFSWVENTPRTMSIYSQGVNQSAQGTDKVNAIINCHLATGRLAMPGAGPFSITGQPNAMGGREVGGLANQLAAHMDFAPEDVDRVRRFWNTNSIAWKPGLKAVDLFEAMNEGRIKALWVMSTNPAVSMPNADFVRDAIKACPFVVVQDVIATGDTVQLADVKLPALSWGEKSGTVTNSERRVSRQRSFLKPPGDARADWDIVCDVARRMGFDGFDFHSPAEIFAEHAALSEFENNGTRDFDLGAYADLSEGAYDTIEPFQWPARRGEASATTGTTRMFADRKYFTPSGRAQFVATSPQRPVHAVTEEHPLRLNTGRVRDHWHTMTRTGKTSRLSEHFAEPYLEVHPTDAHALGIEPATIVRVSSKWGEALLRAKISTDVRPGNVAAPMHWTSRFSSHGRIDAAVNPAFDDKSGQPELKHTPVSVESLGAKSYVFMVCRDEPSAEILATLDYWSLARAPDGWRLEGASLKATHDMAEVMLPQNAGAQGLEVLAYSDASSGQSRRARFVGSRLESICLVGTAPVGADRAWMSRLLDVETFDDNARYSVLAGRPPAGEAAGPLICSCKGVGALEIERAACAGATDLKAIGKATGAGITCGSCKPEITRILEALIIPEQSAAE